MLEEYFEEKWTVQLGKDYWKEDLENMLTYLVPYAKTVHSPFCQKDISFNSENKHQSFFIIFYKYTF